jgi:hypothetical protein
VEGNPVFTDRLQSLEDFTWTLDPDRFSTSTFLPHLSAQAKMEFKLYLDTINKDKNYWGSSIFDGHQDVRKSAAAEGWDGQNCDRRHRGFTLERLAADTALIPTSLHLKTKKGGRTILES